MAASNANGMPEDSPRGGDAFGSVAFSKDEEERIQHALQQKLGREDLSVRAGPGGTKVTYIEGWRAVDLANATFKYNGWSCSVLALTQDYMEDDKGKFNIGYTAVVRVQLKDGSFHEDVGFGSSEGLRSKSQAIAKAKKEAITDARKRALRLFGNLLGNSIFDKEHVKRVKAGRPIVSGRAVPAAGSGSGSGAAAAAAPTPVPAAPQPAPASASSAIAPARPVAAPRPPPPAMQAAASPAATGGSPEIRRPNGSVPVAATSASAAGTTTPLPGAPTAALATAATAAAAATATARQPRALPTAGEKRPRMNAPGAPSPLPPVSAAPTPVSLPAQGGPRKGAPAAAVPAAAAAAAAAVSGSCTISSVSSASGAIAARVENGVLADCDADYLALMEGEAGLDGATVGPAAGQADAGELDSFGAELAGDEWHEMFDAVDAALIEGEPASKRARQ